MSSWQTNPYEISQGSAVQSAALADEWERTTFLRRTYGHLAGAVAAFIALQVMLFTLIPPDAMANAVGTMVSGWNWLLVLGAFMVVSWIANSWANSATSLQTQYLGLGLYVVALSLICMPLLFLASQLAVNVIPTAGLMTGVVFAGLTGLVFTTRADFSWMGRYLGLAAFAALGFIVCAILLGFSLGLLFSSVMVVLASAYILYETSNVMHHYRTTQYVAASLALFASVGLLFWYILQIVMAFSRD
jgi:FtsH-binding integral membrane protein